MATSDAPPGEVPDGGTRSVPVESTERSVETSIADAGSADRDRRRTVARGIDPPVHPRLPAALLMLAVVVLLVVVSVLSVLGQAR